MKKISRHSLVRSVSLQNFLNIDIESYSINSNLLLHMMSEVIVTTKIWKITLVRTILNKVNSSVPPYFAVIFLKNPIFDFRKVSQQPVLLETVEILKQINNM